MRIAVCFSGHLRSAVEASTNIRAYLGSWANRVDYFIHTWDHNLIRPLRNRAWIESVLGHRLPDYVEKDRVCFETGLSDIIKIYRPCRVEVENYAQFRQYLGWIPWQCQTLFYSHSRSVKLALEWSTQCGFRYDVILKLRPDQIVPISASKIYLGQPIQFNPHDFQHDLLVWDSMQDHFLVQNWDPNRIDDVVWLASAAVMQQIAQYWPHCCQGQTLVEWVNQQQIPIGLIETRTYAILRTWFRHWPIDDFSMIWLADRMARADDFGLQIAALAPSYRLRFHDLVRRLGINLDSSAGICPWPL